MASVFELDHSRTLQIASSGLQIWAISLNSGIERVKAIVEMEIRTEKKSLDNIFNNCFFATYKKLLRWQKS